jgi:membrane-bound lytic murein transglycosylase F
MGRYYALPCIACLLLAACGEPQSILEQIQEQNELIVISRNGPTTFYEGTNGPTGFEYELTKLFADDLGVELSIVVPPNFNDILPLTALGDVHFAAAGLSVTEKRKKKVRFGPTYQKITPQLVYRSASLDSQRKQQRGTAGVRLGATDRVYRRRFERTGREPPLLS